MNELSLSFSLRGQTEGLKCHWLLPLDAILARILVSDWCRCLGEPFGTLGSELMLSSLTVDPFWIRRRSPGEL